MKTIYLRLVTLASLTAISYVRGHAQTQHDLADSALLCSNRFNWKLGNADSSVFFLQRLSIIAPQIFPDLLPETIDQTFIQNFIRYSDVEIGRGIKEANRDLTLEQAKVDMDSSYINAQIVLNKAMQKPNALIAQYLTPLKFWVDAQSLYRRNESTKHLTDSFLKEYINNEKLDTATLVYYLKYALLLHQIERVQKNNSGFADAVLDNIYKELGSVYSNYKTMGSGRKEIVHSKAKWLYAYAAFLKGRSLLEKGRRKEAEPYYRQAALLSPNLADQGRSGRSYFYDAAVLTRNPEKEQFYSDYLSFLEKEKASSTVLQNTMLEYALNYPSQKANLEKYYNEHNDTSKVSFANYWSKKIGKDFVDAPMFSVKKIDGQRFDLSQMKGKWVLLDFWGTWCGPCRMEHPDLNQFYVERKKQNKNVEVMTIACQDDLARVKQYMSEKKYEFPVAMQQEKIDIVGAYPVNGYPSKFLINPEGKYIVVPFGIDWQKFVSAYID